MVGQVSSECRFSASLSSATKTLHSGYSSHVIPRTLRLPFLLLASASLLAQSVAKPAPEIALADLNGQKHALADFRGKIVVLNFWATWCIPCEEEMPLLKEVQKKHGERVTVIAVSLDEENNRANVENFVKRHKLNFPVWMGGTTADLGRFGLGEALPGTAFIDEEGRIVGRVLGMLKKKQLRHRVAWMLGERKGKPPEALINNLGF